MALRVSSTALVTLNVFQNSLAQGNPCWKYYADLLRRLTVQAVTWYCTEVDLISARLFWDLFGCEADALCQAAYRQMAELVIPCPIDEHIREESGQYSMLNFCDALRLTCARDRQVDAIVTWEPEQFVRSVAERYQVQMDGFFYTSFAAENADTGELETFTIGVFSVNAFLLHLDRRSLPQSLPTQRQFIQIKKFQFISKDDREASINKASLTLCDSAGRQLEVVARGNSPFNAIQTAIDRAVDQWCLIPARHLTQFFIVRAPVSGASAPVEVVVGVECNNLSFQQSAYCGNCIRAAADAYIRVINAICAHFGQFSQDAYPNAYPINTVELEPLNLESLNLDAPNQDVTHLDADRSNELEANLGANLEVAPIDEADQIEP